MKFVDTNVIMYAVGGEHPLRARAQNIFLESVELGAALATSAEVLQELMHVYLPVNRIETLDRALELIERSVQEIWSLEAEDVRFARALAGRHRALGARDLVHLACCKRRRVQELVTFDRALASAFRR